MNIKGKRGQIGITLTWFVAFLAIFFIMLLFVGFSSLLAGKKAVLGWIGLGGFSETEAISEQGLGGLESQYKLFYLLNSPVDENKNLKNTIIEWYSSKDEKIKKEIEGSATEILNAMSSEEDCYLFRVNYDPEIILGFEDYILIKSNEIDASESKVKEQIAELNIPLNDKKINTGLYFGGC